MVVTNEGSTFCAGANLKEQSGAPRVHAQGRLRRAARRRSRGRRLPWSARSAGTWSAAATDSPPRSTSRSRQDDVKFGFTEVRLGVAPAIISVVCLPKMRRGEAMEAFLRGQPLSRRRAAAELRADQSRRSRGSNSTRRWTKCSPTCASAGRTRSASPSSSSTKCRPWSRRKPSPGPRSSRQRLFRGDEAAAGMKAFLEARESRPGRATTTSEEPNRRVAGERRLPGRGGRTPRLPPDAEAAGLGARDRLHGVDAVGRESPTCTTSTWSSTVRAARARRPSPRAQGAVRLGRGIGPHEQAARARALRRPRRSARCSRSGATTAHAAGRGARRMRTRNGACPGSAPTWACRCSRPRATWRPGRTARRSTTWSARRATYSDRIKNIATIGVKTFGWTFVNRKLEIPGAPPYVRLECALRRGLGVERTERRASACAADAVGVLSRRDPGSQRRRHEPRGRPGRSPRSGCRSRSASRAGRSDPPGTEVPPTDRRRENARREAARYRRLTWISSSTPATTRSAPKCATSSPSTKHRAALEPLPAASASAHRVARC